MQKGDSPEEIFKQTLTNVIKESSWPQRSADVS